jgi:two-component system alkaline phosphatase synthesis response regulator PhoP
MARIRAVLRRAQGETTPPKVIRVGELVIDADSYRVEVQDQPVHLTPTEFGLLRALAENTGHTLTRLELIEKGLGYSFEGLERTVDSHIKNLRKKLEDSGGADLIETVFGVGYRLMVGDDR